MMKNLAKHISLVILALFTTEIVSAQIYDENELPCAYDLLEQTPTSSIDVPSDFTKSNEGDFIIPVVVHVIHNNGIENISDAQILSAI